MEREGIRMRSSFKEQREEKGEGVTSSKLTVSIGGPPASSQGRPATCLSPFDGAESSSIVHRSAGRARSWLCVPGVVVGGVITRRGDKLEEKAEGKDEEGGVHAGGVREGTI